MSQVDVLRPTSTRRSGAGTAVPSGTLHGVTSDDSDLTYISFPVSGTGNNVNLRVGSHTPPANHERHRARVRARLVTNAGTCLEQLGIGRGTTDVVNFTSVPVTGAIIEQVSSWFQDAGLGLATAGALADLNVDGGRPSGASGATFLRMVEYYLDVDCRSRPEYTPDVLDAAGVSRSGGTVTDTNRPTVVFGGVARDGLTALDWSLDVDGFFADSGTGEPPTTLQTDALPNGSFTATLTVRSSIRGSDAISHVQELTFDVDFQVPPPPPPGNVTVTYESGGIRVCWENPGGQPWDDDFVVAEVFRDDCDGTRRIAVIEDGLTACYLDLAVPTINGGVSCEPETCDVTYRIRYWGTVTNVIVPPANVPDGMIVGWPSTVASIPSGWTRVTALDDRYPRGSSAAVSGAVGGSATHSHTTPGHTHAVAAHSHTLGGSTGASSTSTTSARFNGASQTQADQPHTHARAASTGSASGFTSGSAAPAVPASSNLPPTRTVVWIESDGTPTEFPAGALAFATEDISGWELDASSSGRYLRGATTGADGGVSSGATTHTHSVDAHSHTGNSHSHTVATTGLSNPLSSIEAGFGSTPPEWLPRHTHPMSAASSATGSTSSSSGGTTGTGSVEPPNRRVNVVRSLAGGLQTRLIGLFRGDAGTLPATLTRCDSTDGTPDMRDWFARDRASDSLNSTGGTSTHTHTTPSHGHTLSGHTHTTSVGVSSTGSFEAPSFGDLGDSPTEGHTHSTAATSSATPSVTSGSAGTTSSGNHVPPYEDVHFVRIDGVSSEPIEVPQVLTSEFATATVAAPTVTSDRLAGADAIVEICPTRSYTLPRLSHRATQLTGGLPTVATTTDGQHVALTLPVRNGDVAALEALLAETFVWYAPLDGPSGYYAPSGWSVRAAAPGVKELSVTLVAAEPPALENPEDLL